MSNEVLKKMLTMPNACCRTEFKRRLQNELRNRLITELLVRKNNNHSYSLRAFARDLAIDSSRLLKILRGHRPIGLELFGQISTKLNFTPEEIAFYTNRTSLPP